MSDTWEFEARLRQALAPVDPPADLELRLQTTLGSIVELAADELEGWELRAMKDPRNRPRGAAHPLASPRAARQGARRARPRRADAPRRRARGAARLPRRVALAPPPRADRIGGCRW